MSLKRSAAPLHQGQVAPSTALVPYLCKDIVHPALKRRSDDAWGHHEVPHGPANHHPAVDIPTAQNAAIDVLGGIRKLP